MVFFTAESFTHWLNAGLVSERLFALNWPLFARRFSTANNALILTIAVLIFMVILQVRRYL